MLLSVSVDLDEIHNYAKLHGLASSEANVVYDRAVPRLSAWARERGIPLTWFVVGRDLDRPENAEAVAWLGRGGDELACHTHSHAYDLTRRSLAEMRNEVEQGVSAIEGATKSRVCGFRAPGYIVTDSLLALLLDAGLEYDSSVFPCPSYYALKAAAMGLIRGRNARSAAIVGSPDALLAPRMPYRVGVPYWVGGNGICEVPIQVTRTARLPFIGTSLALVGPSGARWLARGVAGDPFVNLELHGLDALDKGDGLTTLGRYQRDLRIPWSRKLAAVDAAVSFLRDMGYACVRMKDLARRAMAKA